MSERSPSSQCHVFIFGNKKEPIFVKIMEIYKT